MNIIHVHNLDFNFKLKTSKQIYQKILFTFQLSFYIQFYTIQFYMAYVFLATLTTFNLCVSKNS